MMHRQFIEEGYTVGVNKVARFIEFYNCRRFHSALNYKKPMNVYLEGIKKEVRDVA